MDSLREVLASSLLKRIEKELGRETTLRLLWPSILGPQLAANTKLKTIRGGTLVIFVPDRAWVNSLSSMIPMMLDAVNRLALGARYESVEFVAEPQEFARQPRNAPEPAGAQQAAANMPEIKADAITDPEAREMFISSAEKYFTRGENRK